MQSVSERPSAEAVPFGPVDWSLFIGISLIWGSSFLLIAMGLEGLTSGAVTLVRVGSGAAALVALKVIGSVTGGSAARPQAVEPVRGPARGSIDRRDWPRVVLLSVVWVAVPFTLFPLAQEHINSALTGLLNGATPIFVAIVATIMTGQRPRGSLLVGLILGFIGVVVLSLPSIDEGSSEITGVLMVLAATVCYGVAMNLAGPLQRRYGAVTLMTPILCLATLWLIPIGLRNAGDNRWAADAVGPVLVLGIVGTGLAYWIMATLVGRAGPVRASFITYLIPVVSLVLGVAIRDDRVAPLALIGAGLTTLGALLASGRLRLRSADGIRRKSVV